jgi:hypothetical protein
VFQFSLPEKHIRLVTRHSSSAPIRLLVITGHQGAIESRLPAVPEILSRVLSLRLLEIFSSRCPRVGSTYDISFNPFE